jgi:hypothetical protein
VFVLAHPRENYLFPGSIDPLVPQNRSPRLRRALFPRVPTYKHFDAPAASYLLCNHIVVKSDELTHIESYSCAKPRGEGGPSGTSGERTGSLATRHSPLNPAESTLPRTRESVSKQTTLTLLESALTRFQDSHRKQRTLNPSESTLTQFISVSPLESALPKKGGGGGQRRTQHEAGSLLARHSLLATALGFHARRAIAVETTWCKNRHQAETVPPRAVSKSIERTPGRRRQRRNAESGLRW